MKFIVTLSLCLLISLVSLHADDDDEMLQNSDFSKGVDGWSGDGADATTPGNPLAANGKTSGVTLPLYPDKPTRIYQSFHGKGEGTFTLVCTPSTNCQFTGTGKVAQVASDMKPEAPTLSYLDAFNVWRSQPNPNYPSYAASFNNAIVVMVDRQRNEVYPSPLRIDPNLAQPQTLTFPMASNPHQEYEFYLAFPPGRGSVTVNRLSLVKGHPTAPVPVPAAAPTSPAPNAADNLLANQKWSGETSDDSNGDTGGDLNSSSATPSEATVQLRHSKAIGLSKTFHASSSDPLKFTITATTSGRGEFENTQPFTTVGDLIRQGQAATSQSSLFDGNSSPVSSKDKDINEAAEPIVANVELIQVDLKTHRIMPWVLSLQAAADGPQTYSRQLPVTQDDDYLLILAFPPGHGTFILNQVSVTKSDGN